MKNEKMKEVKFGALLGLKKNVIIYTVLLFNLFFIYYFVLLTFFQKGIWINDAGKNDQIAFFMVVLLFFMIIWKAGISYKKGVFIKKIADIFVSLGLISYIILAYFPIVVDGENTAEVMRILVKYILIAFIGIILLSFYMVFLHKLFMEIIPRFFKKHLFASLLFSSVSIFILPLLYSLGLSCSFKLAQNETVVWITTGTSLVYLYFSYFNYRYIDVKEKNRQKSNI